MTKGTYHHGDLKAAILGQAAHLVAERGADGVSLRELARAAGVSHAAPAHHFVDRRGLFTALAAEGWRKLTVRWAVFFFVLALLNELVWRTQTTDTWVNFKVFGVTLMTFGFAAMQFPLMQKHAVEEKEKPTP